MGAHAKGVCLRKSIIDETMTPGGWTSGSASIMFDDKLVVEKYGTANVSSTRLNMMCESAKMSKDNPIKSQEEKRVMRESRIRC